jgi:hypothetical protein
VVRWGGRVDGLSHLRHDALPVAAPIPVKRSFIETWLTIEPTKVEV